MPPGGKLICLSEVRLKQAGRCDHMNMLVDESLDRIECLDCGEKLNPIHVLTRFAKEETRLKHRREALEKSHAKLDAKKKTKCRHCGSMTPVNY